MINKYLIVVLLLLYKTCVFAQIGINTKDPKITLDVYPSGLDGSTPEGIRAPSISRERLIAKSDAYGAKQIGAIVYVADLSGEVNIKTKKINVIGYYFFDGEIWHLMTLKTPWLVQGSESRAKTNDQNIYQTGSVSVANKEKLSQDTKLGINGNVYKSNIYKIGGKATELNPSAQLELDDDDKGFIINKVALVKTSDSYPLTEVEDGMLVYNTTKKSDENLYIGYYFWKNNQWNKVEDDDYQSKSISVINLKKACVSSSHAAYDTDKGTPLDFGDIVIPTDGSYAFTFKLQGNMSNATQGTTGIYYVALLVGEKLLDTTEVDIIRGSSNSVAYNVTLGSTFKKGDIVTFKLSHHYVFPYPLTLIPETEGKNKGERTSVMWWRL